MPGLSGNDKRSCLSLMQPKSKNDGLSSMSVWFLGSPMNTFPRNLLPIHSFRPPTYRRPIHLQVAVHRDIQVMIHKGRILRWVLTKHSFSCSQAFAELILGGISKRKPQGQKTTTANSKNKVTGSLTTRGISSFRFFVFASGF